MEHPFHTPYTAFPRQPGTPLANFRRMRALACHGLFLLFAASGCGGSARSGSETGGVFGTPDGGTFVPPPLDDPPVVHAPPTELAGAQLLLAGNGVLDAATDKGGGLWAVTATTVYYFPPGATAPFTYDQKDGLARKEATWQDTYYSGTETAPATLPVTFAAVAGGNAGQAVVGNVGAIADRLAVDPATGAVVSVENLQVTMANVNAGSSEEYPEHVKRVVATHKVLVDLDGTYQGTAYLGGWHGFEALHGMNGDCGCMAFEEHQHFIPGDSLNDCDSSPISDGCWDGDVWGLTRTTAGDIWAGDRHFVQLLKQRSIGAHAGLFDAQATWLAAIDVFPGVRDEVHGLAVDDAGGLYVASEGNGLAYLAPKSYAPSYWTAADHLPMNRLHGVVVDSAGDVWMGSAGGGLARLTPASGAWTYYGSSSGLPSDNINAVTLDGYGNGRKLLIATANGLVVYSGD
jgi:hypothetical protein